MKILVLMPLQEQSAYMATGIYKALPHEIQEKCFAMPMFMEFLVKTKVSPNYTYALFDSILSAEALCDAAEKDNLDLLIIGNVKNTYKFDKIFNFQDIETDLLYKDDFIEKVAQIVADEEILANKISHLYTSKDSTMTLHNCVATADFLSAYMNTDPHLEQITEEYNRKIEQLKDLYSGKRDYEA